MKSDEKNVPRREFLKFSAALGGTAAFGVYLTTDARLKAQQPVAVLLQGGDTGGHNYGY